MSKGVISRSRRADTRDGADPVRWAKNKMREKLNSCLGSSGTPDIKCLKGYPGNGGYLKWLARFNKKFSCEDFLLVGMSSRKDFSKLVHAEIDAEIEIHQATLDGLHKSPTAIKEYLDFLRTHLRVWRSVGKATATGSEDKFIRKSQKLIEEYETLLKQITTL